MKSVCVDLLACNLFVQHTHTRTHAHARAPCVFDVSILVSSMTFTYQLLGKYVST